jgi:putative transposase
MFGLHALENLRFEVLTFNLLAFRKPRVYPQLLSPRITGKTRRTPLSEGGPPVRKSRYSDEQIATALRQAELGTPVAEITRKLGISEATFYTWKKRFGSLGTPEIRELRQLREENAKLKQVVADLSLDRAVLQDVLKKKW